MQLSAGARLQSAVCDCEVIVVRPPKESVELRCGGEPMVPKGSASGPAGQPAPGLDGGTEIGKRYVDEDIGLEVLVTQGGAGTLGVGERILELLEAKKLPTSD